MNRLKRIISIILVLVISVGLFVGCSDSQTVETEEKKDYDMEQGIDTSKEKTYYVQNGNSEYKIVIPNEYDVVLEFAANELKSLVMSAGGASLPIIKEKDVKQGDKYFSLGNTESSSFFNADEKQLNQDGFKILTESENVFIKGGNSTATLYGVYDFCEKLMGVRFIAGDCTYVPPISDLYFYPLDIIEIPVFSTRCYFAATTYKEVYNMVRMRLVSPFSMKVDEIGNTWASKFYPERQHSSYILVDPNEYQSEYPEWFRNGQLCLTNGIDDKGKIIENGENNLAKQALENLKKWVVNNPNVDNFFVAENDGSSMCDCTSCSASYQANGGYSGTKLIFLNALARGIEEWKETACPEREIMIWTFAYGASINPPLNADKQPVNEMVVPEPNVGVMIAYMACQLHTFEDEFCKQSQQELEYINDWSSLTNNFANYDYQTNFESCIFWLPHLNNSKAQLIKYHEVGSDLVMSTAAPWSGAYYQALLDTYVYSKLLWNPYRDVSKLIEEFNTCYYTEDYAQYANDFYYAMESHYAILDKKYEGTFHCDGHFDGVSSKRTNYYNAENYPIRFLENLENKILEAIAHVKNRTDWSESEKQQMVKRLTRILIQPEYMKLLNYDDYYTVGKMDYARTFFDNAKLAGLTHIGEWETLDEYRIKLGL